MSMPMQGGRLPVAEGAAAVTPKRSLEQFRLHLLDGTGCREERICAVCGAEAETGLREVWEKSDLPAGKFADEAALFWRLPRLSLQDLTNVVGAVELFLAAILAGIRRFFPFRTR